MNTKSKEIHPNSSTQTCRNISIGPHFAAGAVPAGGARLPPEWARLPQGRTLLRLDWRRGAASGIGSSKTEGTQRTRSARSHHNFTSAQASRRLTIMTASG